MIVRFEKERIQDMILDLGLMFVPFVAAVIIMALFFGVLGLKTLSYGGIAAYYGFLLFASVFSITLWYLFKLGGYWGINHNILTELNKRRVYLFGRPVPDLSLRKHPLLIFPYTVIPFIAGAALTTTVQTFFGRFFSSAAGTSFYQADFVLAKVVAPTVEEGFRSSILGWSENLLAHILPSELISRAIGFGIGLFVESSITATVHTVAAGGSWERLIFEFAFALMQGIIIRTVGPVPAIMLHSGRNFVIPV